MSNIINNFGLYSLIVVGSTILTSAFYFTLRRSLNKRSNGYDLIEINDRWILHSATAIVLLSSSTVAMLVFTVLVNN